MLEFLITFIILNAFFPIFFVTAFYLGLLVSQNILELAF